MKDLAGYFKGYLYTNRQLQQNDERNLAIAI